MAYNWKRADQWRQHPLLTNTWRHSMPGLGIGILAFAAYVTYDKTIGPGSKASEVHH